MDPVVEIKNKLNIVELISEYVKLNKTGTNWKGLCPFHGEKSPSFMVNEERQFYYCFGCNEGGDIFSFLQKLEGIDFPEALKLLAQKAGVQLKSEYQEAAHSKKDTLLAINLLAAEFFHYILLNEPIGKRALEYLVRRGLGSETVKLFKLGYAPQSWDALGRFLKHKGYASKDSIDSGLLIGKPGGSGFYDRFRGRLMFPIFSARGDAVGFSGRILTENKDQPKYVNTPETAVFSKGQVLYGLNLARESIKKKNEAILVEGNMDVISSYQAGVQNVVAPLGSALTLEQVRALKRYSDQIAICFDADRAGKEAARRGIEIAEQAGMSIKVVQIQEAKDPDELIRKDAELWTKAILSSVPIYDFLLHLIFEKYESAEPLYRRKKIGQEAIALLGTISDKLIQAHYMKILAEKLNLTEEVILEAIQKQKITKPQAQTVQDIIRQKSDYQERKKLLQEYLLSLLLKLGSYSMLDETLVDELSFQDEILGAIWDQFKMDAKEQFNIQRFCGKLKPEVVTKIDDLYLKDWGTPEEIFGQEVKIAVLEIEKIDLQDQLKHLSQKIGEAEKKEDEKELEVLTRQFAQLSKRLVNL